MTVGVTATKRQCSAITRSGERCKGYALHHRDTCQSHSPEGLESRAKAVRASAEARKAKVEARNERVEQSKLTLTQWFSIVAGEHAEALARKAVDSALGGDVRALSIVLDRVEGKVADKLITEAGVPERMNEAELMEWLSQAEVLDATQPA